MKPICQKCACPCELPENDYGEFICQACVDNEAEAAYEHHMESFYGRSLAELQEEARKLK